jgi:L-lactate utilization protein LutB
LGADSRSYDSLLPVWFVEPTVTGKRRQLAKSRVSKKEPELDMAEVKRTLLGIREDSLNNFLKYEKSLKSKLAKKYEINLFSAPSGLDAIEYINNALGKIETVAINRSSAVREILTELPEDMDINFFDSYKEALKSSVGVEISKMSESDISPYNYWDIPTHDPLQVWNSFNVEPSIKSYYRSESPYISGNYASLIGVNCISTDGDLFLMQHLQNMTNILANSKVAFFVVGLEKLVRTYEQGLFQTRCSALFGYETILLDLFSVAKKSEVAKPGKGPKGPIKSKEPSFSEFSIPAEIHLIILDNGRNAILDTEFKDILKCISCNACSRMCPRARWAKSTSYMNARDIIMYAFIQGLSFVKDNGLFDCTLCRNCQDICPVDIPLHDYLLKLRKACSRAGIMPAVHEQIQNNIINFNNPYGIK